MSNIEKTINGKRYDFILEIKEDQAELKVANEIKEDQAELKVANEKIQKVQLSSLDIKLDSKTPDLRERVSLLLDNSDFEVKDSTLIIHPQFQGRKPQAIESLCDLLDRNPVELSNSVDTQLFDKTFERFLIRLVLDDPELKFVRRRFTLNEVAATAEAIKALSSFNTQHVSRQLFTKTLVNENGEKEEFQFCTRDNKLYVAKEGLFHSEVRGMCPFDSTIPGFNESMSNLLDNSDFEIKDLKITIHPKFSGAPSAIASDRSFDQKFEHILIRLALNDPSLEELDFSKEQLQQYFSKPDDHNKCMALAKALEKNHSLKRLKSL